MLGTHEHVRVALYPPPENNDLDTKLALDLDLNLIAHSHLRVLLASEVEVSLTLARLRELPQYVLPPIFCLGILAFPRGISPPFPPPLYVMSEFDTLDSSEKATLGGKWWWPQAAKQEGDKIRKKSFCLVCSAWK